MSDLTRMWVEVRDGAVRADQIVAVREVEPYDVLYALAYEGTPRPEPFVEIRTIDGQFYGRDGRLEGFLEDLMEVLRDE